MCINMASFTGAYEDTNWFIKIKHLEKKLQLKCDRYIVITEGVITPSATAKIQKCFIFE